MTTTSSHRAPSKALLPSKALFPFLPRSFHETLTVPRLKRRPSSHYRPVSQLLMQEADIQPQSIKLSRRDSIAVLMAIPDHVVLEVDHQPSKDQERDKKEHFRKAPPVPPRKGPVNGALIETFRLAADLFPMHFYDDSRVSRPADIFVEKKVRRHPCPGDVYMQSLDQIMLENEKYSNILLRRLASSVPTFSTSMDKQPSNVLDLGCGQGHWLLDASHHWPYAKFTGFDLVDVLLPEVRERPNISLVQGDFIKYSLPFQAQSFDFVRLAELSLAIPREKWDFVLSEARRVLAFGGQIEVIDDQLYFPYGPFPSVPPLVPSPSVGTGSLRRNTSRCRGKSDSISPTLNRHKAPTTYINPTKNRKQFEFPLSTAKVFQRRVEEYCKQWLTACQISHDVEDTFVGMLQKSSVHPSPQDFIPDLLRSTFGPGNVCNARTFDIQLAPLSSAPPHRIVTPASLAIDNSSDQGSDNSIERKPPQHSLASHEHDPTSSLPSSLQSAKAADRLGISYSDLVTVTASLKPPVIDNHKSYFHPVAGGIRQSPGIIVAPSTFIPLTPVETDFHACKWIHTLLGWRTALADYIHSSTDSDGNVIVADSEWNDALWTYESFRRQRFHWPTNAEYDPDSFTSPPIINNHNRDFQSFLENNEEPIHIRTIRVYHATRTEMSPFVSSPFSSFSCH